MPDVRNKELHSIVIVLEDGLESFVMSSKSHAKLLLRTEVYLAPSCAKTVVIAKMQMTEQIVMSASAALDSKEAIAREI